MHIRTMTLSAVALLATLALQWPLVSARLLLRGSGLLSLTELAETPNPLLADGALPQLAAVLPEHAVPAVTLRLQEGAAELQRIEVAAAHAEAASAYEEVVLLLQHLSDVVGKPWGLVQHLKSVRDSPGLRVAVESLQPKIIAFSQNVSQSKPIYKALLSIRESPAFAGLSVARRRVVEQELLARRLSGAGLVGPEAEEFNKLTHELSDASMAFSNHMLDSRKAWNLTIKDSARVRGIPNRTLVTAAERAKSSGHKEASAARGPWVFTLDFTILGPVLTFAEDRALREQLFRASATVASTGENSNEGVVSDILKLRQRQAELLGYASFADGSFETKMATKEQVHKLLDEMQAAARPAAQVEDAELRAFAQQADQLQTVEPWDRSYYAEHMKQDRYGINTDQLRVFFPYPKVVKGMFSLCERLFGVTVQLVDHDSDRARSSRWHDDVELYDVLYGNEVIGYLFMDPYARPSEKQGGAWMGQLANRRVDGPAIQLPIAALVMNFPAPAADGSAPSLLSWDEAGTLFHEFGHGLQNVLTTQKESAVSGINGIEWDAVEVASQFLEYWVELDRRTVYSFARHFSSGEVLPEATYQQLEKSRNFRAASVILAQVYMGKLDLRLHEHFELGENPTAIGKSLASEVLVVQPLPEARPLCTFSHIFDGGYAAAYYSYAWSKVLSADAFSAFEEGPGGLKDDAHVRLIGRRWADTVLALGGGQHPGEVFKEFRGREPSPAALLRYSGLAPLGQKVV